MSRRLRAPTAANSYCKTTDRCTWSSCEIGFLVHASVSLLGFLFVISRWIFLSSFVVFFVLRTFLCAVAQSSKEKMCVMSQLVEKPLAAALIHDASGFDCSGRHGQENQRFPFLIRRLRLIGKLVTKKYGEIWRWSVFCNEEEEIKTRRWTHVSFFFHKMR